MSWSTWNERSSAKCYYFHYPMVISKKCEVLFHHYTHYAVIHLKKANFNSILEMISILCSLLRWSWQIYIYISTLHSTLHTLKSWITNNNLMIFASTFTTPWLRKKRDSVHVATTLTMLWSCQKNKSIYILTLPSLSIYFVVAATFTTPWS